MKTALTFSPILKKLEKGRLPWGKIIRSEGKFILTLGILNLPPGHLILTADPCSKTQV